MRRKKSTYEKCQFFMLSRRFSIVNSMGLMLMHTVKVKKYAGVCGLSSNFFTMLLSVC
jgi:hypothetical protein